MSEEAVHPGSFIKANVIPAGVSVKRAAELIGVGRPALSNLVNGKAALSAEMAMRLEKAFGADGEQLLAMQRTYDQQQSRSENEVAVRKYAPSFMDITARQISAWAEGVDARARLAVLLRRLVSTTGSNLSKADFPAYDSSQRHGWDGQVETDTATPWIPAGASGWEFGCDERPKQKAEEDYAARVKSVPADERANLTFLFVTPHGWPGKDAWAAKKATEMKWKNVKAFDASDLEQWLEQSVPAQYWLAEQLGTRPDGMSSIEECWRLWAAATDPNLSKALFAGSVETHRDKLARWLANSPSAPFVVTSDSEEESLAFLACALDAAGVGDNAVVLRSVEALRRATASSSTFIAVVASPEVEMASSGLHAKQHTMIVRRRNAVQGEPDVALGLADDKSFRTGLLEMGKAEHDIPTLARASGQSLTILRRRLSVVPEIQFPPWAAHNQLTRSLIPLGLVGAWDSSSKEDQEILSRLVADDYESIERSVTELLGMEHSPVWAVGRHRGVASKLDVLYAVHRLITKTTLEDFFLTARIVLSERDPALDLPEEKRSMAGIYGKVRNHSRALRDGMLETLVLLAIHGNQLFRDRLGYDIEAAVDRTVRYLLMPFAAETWASRKGDLPLYAEAAPDVFLDIVEGDLRSAEPKIFTLMKPASTDFFGGGCPRAGLLWALELLAWKSERLHRVAAILARLSAIEINDNWTNKPERSLETIFRWWMPQTTATIERRCEVLQSLIRHFPEVGWHLCVKQFEIHPSVGRDGHRPRWRKDASGAGRPDGPSEAAAFARKALDLAIDWPSHDERTLGQLVQQFQGLDPSYQERIWNQIRAWIARRPSEAAKAVLREHVRVHCFTRRARRRGQRVKASPAAQEIYQLLEPTDTVARHSWLFERHWVEESRDEIESNDFDYQGREERIGGLRRQAIAEVWRECGYDGVIKLASIGEAANLVGWYLAALASADLTPIDLVTRLIAEDGENTRQADMCLLGFLLKLTDAERVPLLTELVTVLLKAGTTDATDRIVRALKCAPLNGSTWRVVDAVPESMRTRYWREVHLSMLVGPDDAREFVNRLLAVGRPKAALASTGFQIEALDSALIVRLLEAVATTSSERDTNIRFHSHDFTRAFEVLDKRGEIDADAMARLEFLYLSALQHDRRGIPHLERQLAESPALFAQAVGLAFRRTDGGEDPPEWRAPNDEARKDLATQAYELLHKSKRLPGTDDDGKTDAKRLAEWVEAARAQCASHGRERAGDMCIGELLSKSVPDNDGIWPAIAVRELLEAMGNPSMANAMVNGRYNQRGPHWRDVDGGGRQERELAEMYRHWSKRTAAEWPFTSRMLEEVAKRYDFDAKWHDDDRNLQRRLG
jgi:addiction module HigA family antidote